MKYSILITFLLFNLGQGWSAENRSGDLSLAKCMTFAHENNPEYRMYLTSVTQAELELKSKYGTYLPSLSARVGHSKTQEKVLKQTTTTDNSQATLNLNLNVFNGMSDNAVVDEAKLNLELQKKQLQMYEASFRYEIKKAYYNYVYATELLELSQSILKRRKDQVDMINLRYQGGREDQGSAWQAEAKYQKAKLEYEQTKRLLESSWQNLISILGSDQIAQNKPIKLLQTGTRLQFSEEQLRELAKETPEYKIAALQISIAQEQIKQKDAAFYPSVDLAGATGKSGEDWRWDDRQEWSVSVNVTIPIFEGGSRYYQSAASRKKKLYQEYNVSNKRNVLTAQLNSLYSNYVDNYDAVKVQRKFLDASRLRSEVVTKQYQQGTISYTNWDLVQDELINYEKNLLLSLKNVLLAKAQFFQQLGHSETDSETQER